MDVWGGDREVRRSLRQIEQITSPMSFPSLVEELNEAALSRVPPAVLVVGLMGASFAISAGVEPDVELSRSAAAVSILVIVVLVRMALTTGIQAVLAHPVLLLMHALVLWNMALTDTIAGPGLLTLAASIVLLDRRWFLAMTGLGLFMSLDSVLSQELNSVHLAAFSLNLGGMVGSFIVRVECTRGFLVGVLARREQLAEQYRIAARLAIVNRESALLRKLTEASVEGLIVYDLGQIVECNDALLRWTGLSREEIRRRGVEGLLDESDREVIRAEITRPSGMRIETTLSDANGHQLPVRVVTVKTTRFEGRNLTLLSIRNRTGEEKRKRELQALAYVDPLSGLANRRGFLEQISDRLEVLRRDGKSCACLYFDVNRFKAVNDILGHEAGDEVLAEVARRISQVIREGDIAGRLAGDEFAVFVGPVRSREEADRVVCRFQEAMQEPILVDHKKIQCSVAVGVEFVHGCRSSPEELLRRSDDAMYRKKRTHREKSSARLHVGQT